MIAGMRNLLQRRVNLDLAVVAAGLACVVVLGLTLAVGPAPSLAFVGVVMLLVTIRHPGFFIALTGASIPFAAIAAASVGNVNVAFCDILALISIASMMLRSSILPGNDGRPFRESLAASKPIVLLALPYVLIAALLTTLNYPAASTFFTVLQRGQLVLMWVVFGAMVYRAGLTSYFLRAFVSGCAVLSLLWIASPGSGNVIGVQKNPSGGAIASAVLIMLISQAKNIKRLPITLLLVAGLVSTGSRGSILGLVIAVGVLIALKVQWKRLVFPLLVGAAAAAGAISMLPESVSSRLLNESSDATYNADIRQIFIDDAISQFQSAPWTGVGVGNYMQIDLRLLWVMTRDPHNVYVLTLVEGGYLLFAAFSLLVFGTLMWIFFKKKTWICALAIAVQVSTFAHSWVDVYWVRGTPAVGWALTGALAMSVFLASKGEDAHGIIRTDVPQPRAKQTAPHQNRARAVEAIQH
jgi:O-antigen ligase